MLDSATLIRYITGTLKKCIRAAGGNALRLFFIGVGNAMEDCIRPTKGRILQKRKAHRRALTPAKRRRFLDALAGNCNVRRSAQIADANYSTLYVLRRRDPDFARQWQEAMAIGYARLEEAVLAYSLRSVGALDSDDEPSVGADAANDDAEAIAGAPAANISPEAIKLAMDIAARHRSEAKGQGYDARGRKRATSAETDAVLRRKLDALARKVKAQLGDG